MPSDQAAVPQLDDDDDLDYLFDPEEDDDDPVAELCEIASRLLANPDLLGTQQTLWLERRIERSDWVEGDTVALRQLAARLL